MNVTSSGANEGLPMKRVGTIEEWQLCRLAEDCGPEAAVVDVDRDALRSSMASRSR
jgi:hypothetical protein